MTNYKPQPRPTSPANTNRVQTSTTTFRPDLQIPTNKAPNSNTSTGVNRSTSPKRSGTNQTIPSTTVNRINTTIGDTSKRFSVTAKKGVIASQRQNDIISGVKALTNGESHMEVSRLYDTNTVAAIYKLYRGMPVHGINYDGQNKSFNITNSDLGYSFSSDSPDSADSYPIDNKEIVITNLISLIQNLLLLVIRSR